jgi:hypothetical protein
MEVVMHPPEKPKQIDRREFVKMVTVGSIAAAIPAIAPGGSLGQDKTQPPKPGTNIKDSFKVPRNAASMPGKMPGAVIQTYHDGSIVNDKVDLAVVDGMVGKGLMELTGTSSVAAAWKNFVTPEDVVGLKVNPVAGKTLSTSLEITHAIIRQLEEAGVPKKNIVIWDRR